VESAGTVPLQVHYGCIRTDAHTPLTQRLLWINNALRKILDKHQPTAVALETLFFVKNAKTLAQVGHARGVVLLIAAENSLPVYEYAPRQVKMAITGYGDAEKKQMQLMIQKTLGLPSLPQPDDAADALAIALCHAQYLQAMGKSAATV
jgi:crossover junction endodeoxyribonuclease RuvC